MAIIEVEIPKKKNGQDTAKKGKGCSRPTIGQHRLLGIDPGRGGRQGRANQAADRQDTPACAGGGGDDGTPRVRKEFQRRGQQRKQLERARRKNGAS